MDQDADQAADDGAVDPDELQVAADVELDPVGGLLAVPPLDGVRDDRGELGAVPVDDEDRGVGGDPVEPPAQVLVDGEPLGEGDQLGLQPAPQLAVRVAQRPEQGLAQRVPQRDAGRR